MIDHLTLLDASKVNITSLSSPSQIIKLWKDIFIFKPTLFSKHSSQLIITSLNDKYFLVYTAAITSFPCIHVNVLLFVNLLLLILTTINIYVVSIFYLCFLWQIHSRKWLWFVLQTSKLLVGHIVKLNSSTIFTFTLKQLTKNLLYLWGLHWHQRIESFAFEVVKVIISSIKYSHKGDKLISKVDFEYFVFKKFGFHVNFVFGNKLLFWKWTKRSL